jgi:hypothetical protein
LRGPAALSGLPAVRLTSAGLLPGVAGLPVTLALGLRAIARRLAVGLGLPITLARLIRPVCLRRLILIAHDLLRLAASLAGN